MNEPIRLRDSDGPARLLMGGAALTVPSASRRRALAFTSAAAHLAASGSAAAAGATSLFKSVVVCVCLGTAGGGVVSLGVSETIAHLDARSKVDKAPQVRKPTLGRSSSASVALPAAPDAPPEPPPEVARPRAAAPERAVKDTHVVTRPAPTESVAAAGSGSSLFEEQRIIESARAAVARGEASAALATLDGYERRYGQGQFGPEALALRIEALSARGELARARGLAGAFRQRYPHHPLSSRVQAAVQR